MTINDLIEMAIRGETDEAIRAEIDEHLMRGLSRFSPEAAGHPYTTPEYVEAYWRLGRIARSMSAPTQQIATPAQTEQTLVADCGHRVARSLCMTTSLGTACPDCYDEMSN